MRQAIQKASFVGSKKDLRAVIDTLKSTGAFQMTAYKKTVRQEFDNENYEKLIGIKKRLEAALQYANIPVGDRIEVGYNDLKSFPQYEAEAETTAAELERVHSEIDRIGVTINQNYDSVRGLGEYINLPVPFSLLSESRSVVILCGIMPKIKFEQMMRDFSNAKINIESFPSGKTNMCIVVTAHREDAAIADVIHSYDFVPCRFTYDKDAKTMIKTLRDEIAELDAKRTQLQANLKLNGEQTKSLKYYYDYICNEADTIDIVAGTVQTEKYYILNGWVIADQVPYIEAELKKIAPDIDTTFETPDEKDNVPVLLKNSKIVAPFRNITEMYGVPGSRDVDPNPWVAAFYFLFFGMMIADIGYALILGLAVGAFIYFKKPTYSTKQFLLLFGICSASALIWGVLFGSLFGFKVATQVIDPMGGAIYVLILSLVLGLVQMAAGFMIDTWNKFRSGHYLQAVLKGVPRIILFIGLLLFIPQFGFQLFGLPPVAFFDRIAVPGMWVTIVGAVLTACSNPYSLISYFNDLVSYVRLFALSLVGAVIASVGNVIGEMCFQIPFVGYPFGIIVAILFHVFNLGLGLLGAYIHGARLQFIEFFSKFYSGDGEKFSPVGGNLKYIIVKRGKQ